jgi:hypothetical protein
MTVRTPLSEVLHDPALITLSQGSHPDTSEGVCLLEAVSWWVGEKHSDFPECVDPILANLGQTLNDSMLDHYREGFASLIPLIAGTRDDGYADVRKDMIKQVALELQEHLAAHPSEEETTQKNSLVKPIHYWLQHADRYAGVYRPLGQEYLYFTTSEALIDAQAMIAKAFASLVSPSIAAENSNSTFIENVPENVSEADVDVCETAVTEEIESVSVSV